MKLLSMFAIFTALVALSPEQAAKTDNATVRLRGKKVSVEYTNINGKSTTVVGVMFEKTMLFVEVSQSLAEVEKAFSDNLNKIAAFSDKQLDEARKANDPDKLKQVQKENLERLLNFGDCVAEGTLSFSNKRLYLRGAVRPRDPEDNSLAAGSASIQGEAHQGAFPLGKDSQSTLAIKNGATSIIVASKSAKEIADIKGMIKVTGRLEAADNGNLIIHADKIDEIKK